VVIFFIIQGIWDKVEKVANDPDTPQECLINQLHKINNQLQNVKHTTLWQASLQCKCQSISKNAHCLIPVVDWELGVVKIAEQCLATTELLKDTHYTYVDDKGTHRYTRGQRERVGHRK